MKVGTRQVYLIDPQSGTRENINISISLSFTHDKPWDMDPTNITGYVRIEGKNWDVILKTYAADEIQAVGRLVKLAGAALLGSCEREGRELRTPDRAEALSDPLQLF